MSLASEKLEKMFPTEKNKTNFIVMSILTFGLTKESMANLLGISIDDFLTNYIYPSSFSESIERRWHHISNSQEEAIFEFSNLIASLYKAFLNRDSVLFKELISQITDKEAKKIMETRNCGDKISDSDILVILKYQIKYALSAGVIASLFKIDRKTYIKRVGEILTVHPEYEESYKSLAIANQRINYISNKNAISEGRK